ncbi:hypothetical protein YC2023_122902 [Brassica napus]
MDHTNFVDLLTSQQDSVIPQSTQCTETSSFCEESSTQRKERKKWTPSDDLVLISAWLNTSKDPVVSNEQKAGTFWNRIAAYYAASPKVESGDKRGALQCKQRWQKIKFNLHHAWEELRYDQKWCEHASSKLGGSAKKRKCEDGAETESSQATINVDDLPTKRPAGVKAAKAASAKKPIVDKEADEKFGKLCSIKEKDLVLTERVSKMRLLDSLITKKEPLSEKEEALKSKLLTEMLDASG